MPNLKGTGEEAAKMKGKQGLSAFEDAKPNKAGGGSWPPAGAGDGGDGYRVEGSRDSPIHGSKK